MPILRTARRMDYLNHWSLDAPPFSKSHSEGIFAGTPQREAIARLHYLIAGRMDCGLLMAESGCGLSTLLHHLSRSTGFGDTAVEMVMTRSPSSDPASIWRQLSAELRIPQADASNVLSHARLLTRQGVRLVWLVDEGGVSAGSVARELMDSDAGVTVLLGTDPSLARSVCVELGSCPLRMDLPAFSLEDTQRFVHWSLSVARGAATAHQRSAIFTDSALVRLHELGEGRIAWISRIAELALMVSAAHRMNHVDVHLLESVQAELVRAA